MDNMLFLLLVNMGRKGLEVALNVQMKKEMEKMIVKDPEKR